MADLVADNNDIDPEGGSYDFEVTADSSTAQTIYKGHPLVVDFSVDPVHVRAWNSGDDFDLDTDLFVGLAAEGASITLGSTESTNTLDAWTGVIAIPNDDSWVEADVGKDVWMPDSGTFALSETSGALFIGQLYSLSVDEVSAFIALKYPEPFFETRVARGANQTTVSRHGIVSNKHVFTEGTAGQLIGAAADGVLGAITPSAQFDYDEETRTLSIADGVVFDGDHDNLSNVTPNQHHNRQHAATSAADHTVTGSKGQYLGLSADNALGVLSAVNVGTDDPTPSMQEPDYWKGYLYQNSKGTIFKHRGGGIWGIA